MMWQNNNACLFYDEHKGDLFCYNCGFVLDNIYEIIKISEYQNNKEKEKRNQIQDLLIDYLTNNNLTIGQILIVKE